MTDTARSETRIAALRRKNFCRYYLLLGNPTEAALQAGFAPEKAAEEALALLQNHSCRAYLAKLAAQPALPIQTLVLSGLSRLAFGSAKDAVKLVFSEEMPSDEMLSRLDLFQVAELKRVKGGGVEIKLFDRQKALERLLECAMSADSSAAANALLSALSIPQEEANALDDDEADALLPKTTARS
ncbi:MAG: terminase small subunit [Oscillospiraceae bacterium]|nr:terminase small subunit [Oscillospiraceae bacterium]